MHPIEPMGPGRKTTRRASDVLLAIVGVRVFLWLSVAVSALPGLLANPFQLASYHDEHFWYAHEDAARITLTKYHQLPAWNPFYCGGVPGIGNPQDSTWAPDTLLKIAFGEGPGRRLAYLLLFVLGMEGLYRLARRHDASTIGAAAAAIVFALCSFFLDLVRLGWQSFFSFQLLPWVVLAFYEGLRSTRWRVAGGAFIAWMLLQGGLYSVPYTVLVLAVLVVTTSITLLRKKTTRLQPIAPAVTFVTIGVVAVLLSAAKLFPTMIVVKSLPRLWQASEALPWSDLLARLLKPGTHDGQPAYITGHVILIALLGAGFDRRAGWFVGLAFFFFVIALGDFAPMAPHAILHKLPIFEQLRFPHRYVIVIAFFLCVAFARSMTILEDGAVEAARLVHARLVGPSLRPMPVAVGLLVGAVAAVGAYLVARAIHDDFVKDERIEASMFPMDAPLAYEQPFRQSRGNRWDAQVFAPASLGSLQCFEETAFPQSGKLRGDLPAEEYPLDPAVAKVERLSWTPNVIKLRVEATAATTVLVNQNWSKSWRASVGQARSHEGLLAIDVPAGSYELVVRYRDPWVLIGLLTTVGTLVALGGVLVRGVVRRGKRAG